MNSETIVPSPEHDLPVYLAPHESREEFERMRDRLIAFWRPDTEYRRFLVDQIAALKWKIRRIELLEARVVLQMGDRPTGSLIQSYNRVTRIRMGHYREILRMQKELKQGAPGKP